MSLDPQIEALHRRVAELLSESASFAESLAQQVILNCQQREEIHALQRELRAAFAENEQFRQQDRQLHATQHNSASAPSHEPMGAFCVQGSTSIEISHRSMKLTTNSSCPGPEECFEPSQSLEPQGSSSSASLCTSTYAGSQVQIRPIPTYPAAAEMTEQVAISLCHPESGPNPRCCLPTDLLTRSTARPMDAVSSASQAQSPMFASTLGITNPEIEDKVCK